MDPNEPSKIVGIIDWQSTEIAPLFQQARQPYYLDYDGPPATGVEFPPRPANLEELEPAAREEARAL